jgi:DNA primase
VTLYHHRLLGGDDALRYVLDRGIDLPTIERCQIGYAAGDQLLPMLRWRQLPLWAALRVGLLNRHGAEHLAGRIVVPDLLDGHPTWLIGRDLRAAEDRPKYLGLPGLKPLFAWHQARDQSTVVAVEGVFDLLTLRMWGYPAVALLGTDVRHDLLADLQSFRRVYLALDNDDAGSEATCGLLDRIGSAAVGVALPDDVNDVAELALRPDGQAIFASSLLRAVGSTTATEAPTH